jgi:hypothetical protein
LGEVLNHLLEAYEQRLITEDELMNTERLAKRAIRATTGLIQYLESTPDPKPPGSALITASTPKTRST